MIHANTLLGSSSANLELPSTFKVPANVKAVQNGDDIQSFKNRVDEVSSHVHVLEKRVQEIEQFYSSNSKTINKSSKNKDKGKQNNCVKKQQDHTAPSETMRELICQFGAIMNQVIQGKGARDSIEDKDLGLPKCLKVDGKPRDFSTIRKRMEAKDGTGYSHVREIYADVRSVLKDSMKYNDERSDAHVTAKTLLAKFEEKWLLLLPKVMQEEERRGEDQALQLANHARKAKDVSRKLCEVEEHLKDLKELVLRKCRKMSTLEKRVLGKALTQLSADNLRQALEIVAQGNPSFQATAEEVDLDIDAQSESTLRRLKYFILGVWQARGNLGSDNNDKHCNTNTDNLHTQNTKRKREINDASGNTATKKIKKHG